MKLAFAVLSACLLAGCSSNDFLYEVFVEDATFLSDDGARQVCFTSAKFDECRDVRADEDFGEWEPFVLRNRETEESVAELRVDGDVVLSTPAVLSRSGFEASSGGRSLRGSATYYGE